MAHHDRPLALVTGSSSGIGLELAKIFAAEGHDVVLTGSDRARLDRALPLVSADGDASVDMVVADLSTRDGPAELHRGVAALGRPVDVLCNNAGIGVWGEFVDRPLQGHLDTVQINVAAAVELTHLFVGDMTRRGTGKVLFTSSESAYAPLALAATYSATKAFLHSFALALREEVKDKGVSVTSLLPGPTETDWFRRAGAAETNTGKKKTDPADIARAGYDALMSGDDHVVAPFKDRLVSTALKFLPDRMTVTRFS